MTLRWLVRCVLAVILCATASQWGMAQYNPGSTTTSGSTGGTATASSGGGYGYGNGAAIGIGIGAAAAGAALIYWATHHKTTLVGCVLSGDDGMTLTNERDQQAYALDPGSKSLKAGERLKLKGKKTKDSSGKRTFRVQKVAKDFGPCNGESASNLSPGLVHP